MMTADRASSAAGALMNPETPSGKSAKTENFPVASRLIAPALRPHVMHFYRFARAADDIADNPALSSAEKIARLDAFDEALTGQTTPTAGMAKALALRQSLAETGVADRHARDLLRAFKQDAVQSRYPDWDGLMGYCALSANPVGRYLLALHGEDDSALAASDALCSALQILNHVQDCGDDYREMDRVYLPLEWIEAEGGTVEDLALPEMSQGMHRVKEQTLENTCSLLDQAGALPGAIRSWRLAAEAAIILRLARRLHGRLSASDPLAARVSLSKWDFLAAGIGGVTGTMVSRLSLSRRAVPQ